MGNLLAAVRVASDERMRGMGILAVLNDEALASPGDEGRRQCTRGVPLGLLGALQKIRRRRVVSAYRPLAHLDAAVPDGAEPRIPIMWRPWTTTASCSAAIAGRPRGIVISDGLQSATVPMADAAEEAVRAGIPVVFASRTGGGTTTRNSYGYPGSSGSAQSRVDQGRMVGREEVASAAASCSQPAWMPRA